MNLSKTIFWDTAYDQIDWQQHARYVIGRVVMYGTVGDWRTIQAYYGMERIRDEMLQERYLDARSLSFLSVIFNIPKEQFRCYTEKLSSPPHGDF